MTTVHQVFTIRSFRTAKDRDFIRALQIYDAWTHPQVKTDSREIAYWVDHSEGFSDAKFYVCGLYVSGELVGFSEFIYLREERLIHFDYFIIEPSRRTAGAFHTLAEQMRAFFQEEKLEWDFVSAEIAHLDSVNGVSRYAQGLIRLFRQVGFSQVMADYEQPQLGAEKADTAVGATLMLLTRVEMETISKSRFATIVSGICKKHYVRWYSIYPETSAKYEADINKLCARLVGKLSDKHEIQLKGPERDFSDTPISSEPPLKEAVLYIAKIIASAGAAAAFNILLRQKVAYSAGSILGITVCVFILLSVTVSLTDKKRFEAFKLLISLVSKFFDR